MDTFKYRLPLNPEDVAFHPDLAPLWLGDPRLEGTAGHYPHGLVAFPSWRRRPVPEGVGLLADSGGYDLLTNPNLPIDPREVLRWQIANTSRGVVLDYPPYGDKPTHKPLGYAEALKRTLANVLAALPIFMESEPEGFTWMGAVQGRSREEQERWVDCLSAVHLFSSWALKPHPIGRAEPIAALLAFARDRKMTDVHILGSGGIRALVVMASLAPLAGIEVLSCDCSSPSAFGRRARYMVSAKDGLGFTQLDPWEPLSYKCPCLPCVFSRQEAERGAASELRYAAHPLRVTAHNLLLTVRTYERLRREAKVDAEALLRKVLKPKEAHATLEAFSGRHD